MPFFFFSFLVNSESVLETSDHENHSTCLRLFKKVVKVIQILKTLNAIHTTLLFF